MPYSTNNIAIVAGLRSLGHNFSNISMSGKIATFHFEDNVSEDAMKIEMGKILVDAIRFHQEVRRLSGLARSMAEQD